MKFPFSVRSGGASLVVAVSLLLLPVHAQRPAPKPTPASTATTATPQIPAAEKSPPVTFDTLLAADTYGIYAEVRAVGQQANSQEIAQLIAPFKFESLGSDDLLSLYEFIKSHADALMTSRLMLAMMPTRAGLPELLLAVEMPSVEEARKFVPELRQFVAAGLAPKPNNVASAPATTAATSETPDPAQTAPRRRRGRRRARAANATGSAHPKQTPAPPFQIKRSGRIIAMSLVNFTFKDLRGAGGALLVNEPGFQAARARFSTDTIFVYFNTVRMNAHTKQRAEALEKEWRRQEQESAKENLTKLEAGDEADGYTSVGDETQAVSGGNTNTSGGGGNANTRSGENSNSAAALNGNMNSNVAALPEGETPPAPPPPTPEATPAPKTEKELEEERRRVQSRQFVETLASFAFDGRPGSNDGWAESIGVGASLDGDALVVRGLFVSPSADQPLRPIPFFPVLLSGPAIAAEAPAVLPADTDILASVSLDLPQMYDYLASLMKLAEFLPAQEEAKGSFGEQLAAFEKTNDFRIREDLLAALGNEIAVGMPGNQFFRTMPQPTRAADASPPRSSGPIIVIALNDKESLRKLLPRVLSAVGFAGATEESIVEKRGEVEVLTFSNGTLAFIDRFLVGAPDAATMRRVADAYNSGETLANSERFRDSTSWQSKQAVGQVYVANAMLKWMFKDVTESVIDIEDPAIRGYLLRLDPDPGSITHLATRDSDGLMHELRLPKNLLSILAASELVGQKLSVLRANESTAQWKLRMIHNGQTLHKDKTGRYATLEELRAAKHLPDEDEAPSETSGYEIKVSASGDRFEATATPNGYPKLGRRSYYIDHTGQLRGADTGGKPASESTPIIE